MSAALLCVAAALVVLPGSTTRRRFYRVHESRRSQSLRLNRRFLPGLVCVPAFLAAGVCGAIACAALVATVAVRMRKSRLDREQQAQRRGLTDGLEIVIAELRIGAHPAAACDAASAECSRVSQCSGMSQCSGVAATALAVASARSRLGGSGADAFRDATSVIAPELDRIATAWDVAEREGIALAELLDAARVDLLGRLRFRSRTESSLAGARATGTVLAGLPVLGIALGQLMGAAPLHVLFGGGLGGVLLVLGTVLACAGLLWTDAITARVTA
ncbi:type II secretion system F family protein [Antrihabitans cavernicola]|uniref:Secretion protein F n=1 Tax=Antrihabitans cavernicola TaxID=2495913 RepID=A0A5A7SJS9_9NOCA|nr:hypothetical protein [Spelaeibacter cavernicola]KAA0024451.1 hypothetical protein FOY51_00320 [Spelaeibacter cavernicola]